jgi:transposase-like protein
LKLIAGLSEDGSHGQAPSHSIEFKRQIAQEFIAGETLHSLAKRHDVSRNLIRIWVKKLEAARSMKTPERLTSGAHSTINLMVAKMSPFDHVAIDSAL